MIIQGDALTVLKRMDSESVHSGATSSPYYGLRLYDTEPQIWDGDPSCQHEWGEVHPPGYRKSDTHPGPMQHEGNKNRQNLKSDICGRCGAWRGELGQEPTPELFVKHLTTIFHELKRVLRNDGIFWLNIGDSYAAGAGGRGDIGNIISGSSTRVNPVGVGRIKRNIPIGLKPKDLIGIPWMLAFSMRADGAASPQTMYTVEKIKSSLLQDCDTWNDVPKHTKKTIEDLDEEWLKASKGGWYLRANIPWLKRNSMPSSVTDRPVSSIEHIFLFSKSGDTQFWTHPELCGTRIPPKPDYRWKDKQEETILFEEPENWKTEIRHNNTDGNIVYKNGNPELRYKRFNLWDGHDYYYDYIATMQLSSESYNKDKRPRGIIRQKVNENTKYDRNDPQYSKFDPKTMLPSGNNGAIIFKKQDNTGNETYTGFNARYEPNGLGLRFMRDSDFFFKTWQGLLHNENGEPIALVVNPKSYKGVHFAAYPIKLVEPLILAGTSEKGVCPHCGAPWVRVTKKESYINRPTIGSDNQKQKLNPGTAQGLEHTGGHVAQITETIDWKPTCSCTDNIPVPATVIDPFSGSSATGVACKLHNRDYIGIELNPEYCELGRKRIKDGK